MSTSSAAKTPRHPRRPQPFFSSQTQSWFVQLQGRQIPLGRDRRQAWEKYEQRIARIDGPSVLLPAAQVLDEFLEYVLKNRVRHTYLWYRHYLRSFVAFIGKTRAASEVKPFHVTKWLDKDFSGLSGTSRNCAVRAVKAPFNGSVVEGYLDRGPIRAVERPPAGRRELVLSRAEFQSKILTH